MKKQWTLGLGLIAATTSVMAQSNYLVEARILHNGTVYAQPSIIVQPNMDAEMSIDNKLTFNILVKKLDTSRIELTSRLVLPTSSAMASDIRLKLNLGAPLNFKLGQTAIDPLTLAKGQTYCYEVKVTVKA